MKEENINKLKQIFIDENLTCETELNKYLTNLSEIYVLCNNCKRTSKAIIKNILDSRRKGKICQFCSAKDKFINKLIDLYGRNPYEFISEFSGYENSLTVKCKDCGYIFTTPRAKNLLMMNKSVSEGTHICKNCTKLRRRETKNINDLENLLIQKFGECDYIFPEPENFDGIYSSKKLKIICKKCGHEMFTTPYSIITPKNGKHYCRVCNNCDKTLEYMSYKERCLKTTEGKIEPIENYIDSKTPIKHKCNVCGYGANGEWKKLPVKNTKNGSGCPVCAKKIKVSNGENELYEFIKSIYPGEIITKNRKILNGKEIDIYLPEKKIGFEFNGLFYHSDIFKDQKYHLNKYLEAQKVGIRLIQIFEDEWRDKKSILQSKIKNILSLNKKNSIYARKTIIGDVKTKDKNEFLDKYHIQGRDNASFYKALYYNGEIVAVITFCKPRLVLGNKKQANNDGTYELSRFATNGHIIGGFSKLLKHCIKEYNIKKIITYADLRYTDRYNNVYLKNGFTEDWISEPGYSYVNRSKNSLTVKRENRFKYRKQELKKLFPEIYSVNKSEAQIMKEANYFRIYDCGNIRYSLTINK